MFAGIRPFRLALTVAACLTLAGCGDRQIIDRINLAQTGSYDLDGNRVKTAILIGNFPQKGVTKIQMLDTVSDTGFDMIPRLHTKSSKTVQYGQLRMTLFGNAYAKRGIGSILENFFRDPKITSRMQLAVAKGTASDLLASTLKSNDVLYLLNMIEENIENGNLPRVQFQKTLFDYFGAGRDFYLPYFSIESGEPKIDGIALFKDGKFVKSISVNESFLLKLLTGNARNGSYLMTLPGHNGSSEGYVVLRCISSRSSYRLLSREPVPSVRIDVRMNAILRDIPRTLKLNAGEDLNRLTDMLEHELESRMKALLTMFIANDVDPVGFGDFVRSGSRGWKEKAFYDSYSALKTDVRISLEITQTGIGSLGHTTARRNDQ